ncbi:MAG TPA: CRISPR-associated protein Cas4 [Ktedonobacteraceae bacterium]|nr:CRISPR-associated protein Cas4 [Ktedonobacteraceae bacterium]
MNQKSDGGSDDIEPVMISALEHYSYCPRQCALIHIEQTFDENIYTLRGNMAHERVDQAIARNEDDVRVERGLSLWSQRLGLIGKADVVEFHGTVPYPVEYKLGKQRKWQYEAIQVCAQALCLEEMTGCSVPRGAIYYCSSRVRREIIFDTHLRETVAQITDAVRTMLKDRIMPPAVNDQRCDKCSLIESCLPNVVVRPGRLQYYRSSLFKVDEEESA